MGHELPDGQRGAPRSTSGGGFSSSWTAIPHRPRGQVAAILVQQVEDHVERRRGDGVRVRLAQPPELGAELLVIDRDFPVEHDRARRQLADGRGEGTEAARVFPAVAADEPRPLSVLAGGL